MIKYPHLMVSVPIAWVIQNVYPGDYIPPHYPNESLPTRLGCDCRYHFQGKPEEQWEEHFLSCKENNYDFEGLKNAMRWWEVSPDDPVQIFTQEGPGHFRVSGGHHRILAAHDMGWSHLDIAVRGDEEQINTLLDEVFTWWRNND